MTIHQGKADAEMLLQLAYIVQEQRLMIEKLAIIQREQIEMIKNLQLDIQLIENVRGVTNVY